MAGARRDWLYSPPRARDSDEGSRRIRSGEKRPAEAGLSAQSSGTELPLSSLRSPLSLVDSIGSLAGGGGVAIAMAALRVLAARARLATTTPAAVAAAAAAVAAAAFMVLDGFERRLAAFFGAALGAAFGAALRAAGRAFARLALLRAGALRAEALRAEALRAGALRAAAFFEAPALLALLCFVLFFAAFFAAGFLAFADFLDGRAALRADFFEDFDEPFFDAAIRCLLLRSGQVGEPYLELRVGTAWQLRCTNQFSRTCIECHAYAHS